MEGTICVQQPPQRLGGRIGGESGSGGEEESEIGGRAEGCHRRMGREGGEGDGERGGGGGWGERGRG